MPTVHERMTAMLHENRTRADWSATTWAAALGCWPTTVMRTRAWTVMIRRMRAGKVQTDRRRAMSGKRATRKA